MGDFATEAGTSAVGHEAVSESGLPQCGVRGCAWRGPCPEHDYAQEADPLIAHMVRQRPLNGGRKFHRQAAHYQQTSYHRPKLTVRAVGEALAAAARVLPERKTKSRAAAWEEPQTGTAAVVTARLHQPEPLPLYDTAAVDAGGGQLPEPTVPTPSRPVPKPPPTRPRPVPKPPAEPPSSVAPPKRSPFGAPATDPVQEPPHGHEDDVPEGRANRPLRRRARRRPEAAQAVVTRGTPLSSPQNGAKPAYRRVMGKRTT